MALIVAVALIAGMVWGRSGLNKVLGRSTASGSASSTPTPTPVTLASPTPEAASSASAAPQPGTGLIGLAAPAAGGGVPNPAKVQARLAAVPRPKLGTTTGYVLDQATGTVLYSAGATKLMLPASTMKVLTSLSVLDALGTNATFTTSVAQPNAGTIVLVGGGDPMLASTTAAGGYPAYPTSLQLARATAAALKKQHRTSVRLGFDDTLFGSPSWNPTWPASYGDQVGHIGSLMIDRGRQANGDFSANPGLTAAQTFAAQLKSQGIKATVAGRMRTTSAQARIAQLKSLPLGVLVETTLQHSDNTAAEVLLRQLALADHRPATFAGGVQALQAHLTTLKVWQKGMTIVDGSGLSRSDRVTTQALALAIRTATLNPRYQGLLDGLPVAGVTGTLMTRFFVPQAVSGRGVVHTKTGTLTHVSTFAGYTVTASGRPVVFAFMDNGAAPTVGPSQTPVGTDDWNMRTWLDEISSALAGCGCGG